MSKNQINENSTTGLGIPVGEVQIMVKTYYAYSSLHPQFDPRKHVKSVWFSIDQIAEMAQMLGDEGGDGVRVYFGRYPSDVSTFIDPKPTQDMNSVIFVSTYDNNGQHTDYFTEVHPFDPINRGEQCQPNCDGANVTTT